MPPKPKDSLDQRDVELHDSNVVEAGYRNRAKAGSKSVPNDNEDEPESRDMADSAPGNANDASDSSATRPAPDSATPTTPAPPSPMRNATASQVSAFTAPFEPTMLDTGLDLLLPALAVLYVWLCPLTKVEESFNMQAVHDLLYYGPANLKNFDHFEFPGVVPRTFIGASLLALVTTPYKSMVADKYVMQMAIRSLLGVWTCFTLLRLRNAASKIMGAEVGRWFVVVTAVQFHTLYYASRTLPNIFAFGLVNLALAEWFGGRKGYANAVRILAATAVIFRSEVLLFAGPLIAARWIWQRTLAFGELRTAVVQGAVAALAALALTAVIDGYFWQRWPLWPELEVFRFNGIENRSVEWGAHPWYFYFTNLVPKITASALPMALLSSFVDMRTRYMLLPCLLFLAAYSFLIPHKEWRFVIYVVPLFNIAAARWLAYCRTGSSDGTPHSAIADAPAPSSTPLRRILFLGSWLLLGLNALLTAFQLQIASHNYPGGQALLRLHSLEADRGSPVHVHIDTYAATTGITRFLELRPDWKYSKYEGYQTVRDFWDAGYTHLITSEPQIQPERGWENQYAQEGYGGLHSMFDMDVIKEEFGKGGISGVGWKRLASEWWTKCAVLAWQKRNLMILLPFDVALDDLVWILRRYQ